MKRNGIIIAIFVVTTIIASCFAVYLGLKSSSKKSELESKIENLNSQISSLKSENISVQNNNKEQVNNSTGNENDKNNTFKSYGKLSGVNDIVEIINGNVKYENGGNRAVFAIKQDGSFYELSTMLKNTGKYN